MFSKLETMPETIDWLTSLDKQTHAVKQVYNHRQELVSVKEWHKDFRLKKAEIDCLIQAIKTQNLILTPDNMNWGFDVGFRVYAIRTSFSPFTGQSADERTELVLSFLEKQMPDDTRWNTLQPVFTSEQNLNLLRHFDMEEPREYSHYEY